MDIHFETKKLERFLAPDVIIKNLGMAQAKAYTKMINFLQASDTFASYLLTRHGKPEGLSGDLKGYYSIHLSPNYRLIVRPEAESLSIVDLRKCDSVEVKGVIDYHGSKRTWKTP